MDANGLRFWMLAGAGDWPGLQDAAYDPVRRSLRLAATRLLDPLTTGEVRAQAEIRLALVPQALDEFGARAWWDAGSGEVRVKSSLPEAQPVYASPPPAPPPTDLAVGFDGVLYVAQGGRVVMRDLRDRWQTLTVPHDAAATAAGFSAWRLAAHPAGGVWAIDKDANLAARVQGLPFPDRPAAIPSPTTFRPEIENPDAPRLTLAARPALEADERLVGLAVSPAGKLALLSWRAAADACVRLVEDRRIGAAWMLRGARSPYSIAWLSDTRVSVLLAGVPEAPAYELPMQDAEFGRAQQLEVCGDLYPVIGNTLPAPSSLPRHDGGPFVHGLGLPPRFGVLNESNEADVRPLHRVSLPAYAKRGEAANFAVGPDRLLDSGTPQTCWHRLYLEAAFPPGCGAVVWLAATDARQPPAAPPGAPNGPWHPHVFGAAPVPAGFGAPPRGAWLPEASEIPFHAGLLHCPRARNSAGLFTALVQRAARPVKALRGRYLWASVTLHGDGRATPDIAALRAYATRFSFVEHYLPELYRETEHGPQADAVDGRPTPADFLERFVGNFEGVLTSLEDRVASAYVLTHPASTPDGALAWLGSWIDAAPPPGMPAARTREWLKAAPFLHRRRGTLGGLRLALELATDGKVFRVRASAVRAYRALTDDARVDRAAAPGELVLVQTQDESVSIEALLLSSEGALAQGEVLVVAGGAVSGGELIILEDFRLRRVVATILGADLADEADPLLPGLTVSGNSIVGDTLMLGEEERKEFLALYRADLPVSDAEQSAISALFEQLAHRVTVLAHQELAPVDLGLVRAIAAREAPAHVEARVIAARYPFMAGIASLVGVDTYLAPKPPRRPVRVGAGAIGDRDFIVQAAALDPRVAGAPPRPGTST